MNPSAWAMIHVVDHPTTRDGAWRMLSTLNSIMADGHMVVTFPHWTAMPTARLKHGGAFFPFEVSVAADGKMRIRAKLGGSVTPLSGPLDTLIQLDLDNPLHFSGATYLLIGRYTYSSSVLFANVVQDFGFGKVAGSDALVRADTTGGDQTTVLPNTGLIIAGPRFTLLRPLPNTTPALLTPWASPLH